MNDVAWWVPVLPVTVLLGAGLWARRHTGDPRRWYGGLAVMALAMLAQAWIADVTWVRVGLVALAVVIVPLGHVRRPAVLRDRGSRRPGR